MPLTLKEVEHIAGLAQLHLSDAEKALFRDQLSAILDHAAALQKTDTSAISPTATVLPTRNVLREDLPGPSLSQEDVLANAPDALDGQFRVRAILEVRE